MQVFPAHTRMDRTDPLVALDATSLPCPLVWTGGIPLSVAPDQRSLTVLSSRQKQEVQSATALILVSKPSINRSSLLLTSFMASC